MKSGATKSRKTVCIISLFQLWFKHFTLGAFTWHLELQITLDLKHLQLFAFCLSNRILPRSYHMVLIHLFTFYCHIKCFVNISSDDLQFVIHFQYLLVNFDIFMNKMRNPNLLVIIQNLLNESVNIDTYWGFSKYRYLLVSIDTYWKSKLTLTYIIIIKVFR